MAELDNTPGGTYRKGYESIGVPGYLLAGASAPGYGNADSNGYVGVSQDYNSHANTTDRPGPSSLKAEDPEVGDIVHAVGLAGAEPQLADGDGNEITPDNDTEADNVRGVEVTHADLKDGEAVNHLNMVDTQDEAIRKALKERRDEAEKAEAKRAENQKDKPVAKKAAPSKLSEQAGHKD